VRRALASISLAAAIAVGGCGSDRKKAPDVTRSSGAFGWITVSLPEQGETFERPKEWHYTPGTAPLLATMTSGEATIAVWRYPRTEPLPETDEELTLARDALVGAAKTRDKTFEETKAKATRAAHHPAVVIVANETVAGHARVVRSTHVYGEGGEVVVDAFAPPGVFPKLEDPIFRRVVRSLKISPPR
jgi:hypothetical protein